MGVWVGTLCISRRGGRRVGAVVVFEEVVWWSRLRSKSDLTQHLRTHQTHTEHVQMGTTACVSGEVWAEMVLTSAGVSDFSQSGGGTSSLQARTHLGDARDCLYIPLGTQPTHVPRYSPIEAVVHLVWCLSFAESTTIPNSCHAHSHGPLSH